MKSVTPLRVLTWASLAAGLVLLLRGLPACGTPGWDATKHAFAGLRMGVALRHLEFGAFFAELTRTDFYTGLGRAPLAIGFLLFGDGWAAPRAVNCVLWIATIALAGRLARRMVPEEHRDAAALWTVLFGLTSWLGAVHARSVFLEPLSAFVMVVGFFAYLRACETGSHRRALVCGLVLAAALLMRSTYGLWLLATVGLSALVDVLRPGPTRATVRLWPMVGVGFALPLLWWLVLPLPGGLALGAEHRRVFAKYLSKAAILSSPPASYVPIWLGLTATLSLTGFAVQILGTVWGSYRFASAPHRLCATLALLAPLAMAAYPYRVDRFLVPALFAYWCLGGTFAATRIGLAPRVWRPAIALLLAATVFGTGGVGALTYASWFNPYVRPHFTGDETAEQRAAELAAFERRRAIAAERLREYRHPYAPRRAPAGGPEGTEALLDFAASNLSPEQPFGWIGGTATELPPELVQWKLYQVHGRVESLYFPHEEEDYLWKPLPDGEEGFREWAARFPQVVTLDPPDPLDRQGRDFERDYVRWMRVDPAFAVRAQKSLRLEGAHDHVVTVYARHP